MRTLQPASLKPAFTESMKKLLPEEYERFIQSLTEKSPVSIRLNPAKKLVEDTSLISIPWCSLGRYLNERPVFTLDPVFHAGAYYVQEASSMFLEQAIKQIVDLDQSLHVLDLCAAPGGKSTHLASLISNDSLLVSNEVIRSRASILAENITKWGRSNTIVTNNDPEDFQRLKHFFDVMVIDAPCSGEGLFRKEPEAILEWSRENVDLCWKRQRRIVSDAWPALKPGGTMLYCTCTYNALENEANLLWIQEQYDAEFITIKTEPSWGILETDESGIKGYHLYPHRVKGEGFFISVIRKKDDDAAPPKIKLKKNIFQKASKKIQDHLNPWVLNPDENVFLMWRESILAIPAQKLTDVEFIVQNLHIVSAGTTLAEVKHEKFIPDHALAMSALLNRNQFNSLELTKEQALQFLRKEALQFSGVKKGHTLMTYENIPLGWANVLDNRMNNLYPSNWRIRMSNPSSTS